MSRARHPGPPRVAIVDDEVDVLTFLRLALEDAGFKVLTCPRPKRALDVVAAFEPDLVCLDLLMPEQMGTSLYVAMRENPKLASVPILILSGLNTRDELIQIFRREGDLRPPVAFIEKPVDTPHFLEAVRGALEAPSNGSPP